MKHVVEFSTGSKWTVDESYSLAQMRSNLGCFFNVKHGKRETYTEYRGCLIVRSTVQFTGCRPTRKTSVYLVGFSSETNQTDSLCVIPDIEPKTVKQAKRLIDVLLHVGKYEYGFKWKDVKLPKKRA